MTMTDTASAFFEACETGKGWDGCKPFCHEAATFSCQSDALADTKTLEGYAEWMKGLLTPIPDGHYVLTAFATDEARGTVVATAEFHGTQTGEGGPAAPTGKSVLSDYAYVMRFDGDKISHMTKIWNDLQALRALGWA
jgi:ketosteroid isomerase-like protein